MDIWEWYQQQPAIVQAAIISGIFMVLNTVLAALSNPAAAVEIGPKVRAVDKGVSFHSPPFSCEAKPAICGSPQDFRPDSDLMILVVNTQIYEPYALLTDRGIVRVAIVDRINSWPAPC